MKKDYMTKKKITITALSLVAFCLAGGLIYHISNMGNQTQGVSEMPVIQEEQDIFVPEIENPAPTITEPTNKPVSQEDNEIVADDEIETNPVKPSDDKPRTKEDAVAPTDNTPPTINENGEEEVKVIEPQKPAENTPQGGEIREDGAMFVPGFGWIPYEGENSVIEAPNAGTGDIIGDM